MNGSKLFGNKSSVSMDPAVPGTKPLEVEDLNLELAEPVAAAAKVDDASNNKTPADQLLMDAIREAMVINGKLIDSRVSINPIDHSNVEITLQLPNTRPVIKGVFRLV